MGTMANSEDQVEMLHMAAFHFCFLISLSTLVAYIANNMYRDQTAHLRAV